MTGVPPAGSGSRASHEAASASSPKASIPNAAMLELAERCEGASGPNRELDFAVAQHFGVTVWLRNDDDSANYETTHWHYSSSLDAALSLVPDHSRFGLYRCRDWGDDTCRAWVHAADHSYCEDEPSEELRGSAQAATPALALCAAALRARAAGPQDDAHA